MIHVGRLLVVATPIGNLGDLTTRAVEALTTADLVLAEDTRRTRTLLTHLGIKNKPLSRLDAQVEATNLGGVLDQLASGACIVLVSDAGTPAVSDPGARLVSEAAAAGHEVTSLPGASAVTTAIAASGFGGTRFRFFGFLPRKAGALDKMFDEIHATAEIGVFFEAATRMTTTLARVGEKLAGREIVVARELTKKHEELIRGEASALAAREGERSWRGEITVVVGPRAEEARQRASADDLDAMIRDAQKSGERPKVIAKRLAHKSGWPTREIYQRMVESREEP